MSRRKVTGELVVAPGANSGLRVGGNVVGAPARNDGSGEFLALVEPLQCAARCMAFATVRQRFDQVRAAIPGSALVDIGLEALTRPEQRGPEGHQPALVVRKPERIGH